MRCTENIAPSVAGHTLDQTFSCTANVIRRTPRQNPLGINSAHEPDFAAEFALQFQWIHARAVALNGIENVHANLDEVFDDGSNSATTMIYNWQFSAFSNCEYTAELRFE